MNERESYNQDESMRELLNRHLSGETTAEENQKVAAHLAANPDAARQYREMERVREVLRRAVSAQPVPESLAGSIRTAMRPSSTITMPQSDSRVSTKWYYAAAAVILLLVAGWAALKQFGGEDPSNPPAVLADALGPVREVLRIGMTDHLNCAVTYYKGDIHPYTPQKMREGLGEEFVGLIPVVQQKITEGELVVAHRCSFGGRGYVHMIVKREGKMISLAITRKNSGESLKGKEGMATSVSDIPIYRTAMEGFEVAGFESGEFLVFVASNLTSQNNLQVAMNLAPKVSEFLQGVKA